MLTLAVRAYFSFLNSFLVQMLQLCRAVEAASSIDIHSDIAALCLIKGS